MTSLAFATAASVALAVASSVVALAGFVPPLALIGIDGDDDLGLAAPLFVFDFSSMAWRTVFSAILLIGIDPLISQLEILTHQVENNIIQS
jgi:hypothetical protein